MFWWKAGLNVKLATHTSPDILTEKGLTPWTKAISKLSDHDGCVLLTQNLYSIIALNMMHLHTLR